jgi:hypothetical protein
VVAQRNEEILVARTRGGEEGSGSVKVASYDQYDPKKPPRDFMALFPPNYIKSVVSIEIEMADAQGISRSRSIATGFLLGRKSQVGPGYHVFLVTNRHVFETDKGDRLKEVDLRFNLTDQTKKTKHFKTQLVDAQNNPLWLRHPDPRVDIDVVPLSGLALSPEGIDYYFFQDDTDLFMARDFETNGISTGDGLRP